MFLVIWIQIHCFYVFVFVNSGKLLLNPTRKSDSSLCLRGLQLWADLQSQYFPSYSISQLEPNLQRSLSSLFGIEFTLTHQ